MEENKNQQPQGLQIELKPEIGVGVYANLALITHSSSDFILDFTCMLPGMQQPQVRSRVVMAPEHAKRLLMALNDKYGMGISVSQTIYQVKGTNHYENH